MMSEWIDFSIHTVRGAVYHPAGASKKDGLIELRYACLMLNDTVGEKLLHFVDGSTLHTGPGELRYIPAKSKFWIERITPGGHWHISFELVDDFCKKPFSVPIKDYSAMLKLFKEAITVHAGLINDTLHAQVIIKRCIYGIILQLMKEHDQHYIPSKKAALLEPAMAAIHRHYTENDSLSASELAKLCGISETYFRRLFTARYLVSPWEYVIRLRMDYAKHLLHSTTASVQEIANLCGYAEPCHFTREFTKRAGMSPTAYRELTTTE